MEGPEHENYNNQAYGLLNLTGGNKYCDQCGKELVPIEDPEPYPWVSVDENIYCLTCAEED
jgi:hypothetical protein